MSPLSAEVPPEPQIPGELLDDLALIGTEQVSGEDVSAEIDEHNRAVGGKVEDELDRSDVDVRGQIKQVIAMGYFEAQQKMRMSRAGEFAALYNACMVVVTSPNVQDQTLVMEASKIAKQALTKFSEYILPEKKQKK